MLIQWNQQEGRFYLHEDEWAMIDLLPRENFADLLRTAEEAKTFGEEHFDGFGWTAMYVIPKPTHPLVEKGLPLHELKMLLGEDVSWPLKPSKVAIAPIESLSPTASPLSMASWRTEYCMASRVAVL